MRLPSQATLIQWGTFATLLFVLAPGQIFLQVSHYAQLDIDPTMRLVQQVISAAICGIEALALTLLVTAVKRREAGRAVVFAIFALPLVIIFTLLADVGAVGAQLSRDQAARDANRQEQARIVMALSEADVTIGMLHAAIPEAYRGRPASSLEAEIKGLDRRLAAYANPPQSLLRARTTLDSALATRTAHDKAEADRDALRASQKPPVRENHAQVDTIIALAALFGLSPTADTVRAFLPLFYAVTLKLVLMCGFLLVTPNTAPQTAPVRTTAPVTSAPLPSVTMSPVVQPNPVVTPPPVMTAVTPSAPAQQPAAPGPIPTAPASPSAGPNAKIAGILQRGLPRKQKKLPV